ncbi:MAG TPA: hypothetical protein VNM91_01195 [Dehalococcoidia bacterium]|nr:hypothetical protein [Dehalococcoidia bacterium]
MRSYQRLVGEARAFMPTDIAGAVLTMFTEIVLTGGSMLRSLDAVHLASALEFFQVLTSNGLEMGALISAGSRLIASARDLGVAVVNRKITRNSTLRRV